MFASGKRGVRVSADRQPLFFPREQVQKEETARKERTDCAWVSNAGHGQRLPDQGDKVTARSNEATNASRERRAPLRTTRLGSCYWIWDWRLGKPSSGTGCEVLSRVHQRACERQTSRDDENQSTEAGRYWAPHSKGRAAGVDLMGGRAPR
ncbi:hypothetical protein VTK73DRAFT_148 [Phialemonium thermophilum]|uniref:Uncharacterized protein n=1 Tax=Phialemonium thermophilum TaxID=223376 RepID=A0ABR3XFS8_9PEZI